MSTLSQFPSCCGAKILSGIYKNYGESDEDFRKRLISQMAAESNFTVAISAPEQRIDNVLEAVGFKKLSRFQTRYPEEKGKLEGRLTLWGRWQGGDKMELYDEKQTEVRVSKTVPVQFQTVWGKFPKGRLWHRVTAGRTHCGKNIVPKETKKTLNRVTYYDRCFICGDR